MRCSKRAERGGGHGFFAQRDLTTLAVAWDRLRGVSLAALALPHSSPPKAAQGDSSGVLDGLFFEVELGGLTGGFAGDLNGGFIEVATAALARRKYCTGARRPVGPQDSN